jgi:small-conductance mechanosensitive channel
MNYNVLENWLIAFCVAGATLIALSFVQYLLGRRDRAGEYPLLTVVKKTHSLFLIIISLYVGSRFLELPANLSLLMWRFTVAAVAVQGGLWGNQIINLLLRRSKLFGIVDANELGHISIINFLIKVALWSVIGIFLLGNWGFDITALVAGLGIGGIAVALAVQNILGDIFASLSIVVDKPFTIGDYINIDEYKGHVEHIGLKTTRIRSLSGELLVFSNTDLLKSRVRNFKQMHRRRVTFDLGISVDNSVQILRQLPKIVEEIISKHKLTLFERCHFKGIGDYVYHFETVYWIETPDMKVYLDVQEQINLEIVAVFAERGIVFANPATGYIIQSKDVS